MGWRTHQLIRAFSAYEFFDDSNLGRCPRLQMNRAFGAKHVPVYKSPSIGSVCWKPPFDLFLYNDRHVEFCRVEEMLCHLGRHANTAVRSAVAGNETGVHSVRSSEAKEVGHPSSNELSPRGRVIFARSYVRPYDPAILGDKIP